MSASPSLSVVVPVFNEATRVADTLAAAASEAEAAGFDAEFVVVDDGSTDGTADAVRRAAPPRLHLIEQPNSGRLAARRAGLAAAAGDLVLFLDSRVRIHAGSLGFAAERVAAGERVWNAHVDIETTGNPFGKFWNVLTELAFADYFAQPRTTSYGAAEFDRFPKGTTMFLAPTDLMREAFGRFRTGYKDERNANDDTPILRWLAGRERIHISPRFACDYAPRRNLSAFLRHAEHRGVVFLDGHGHPESRFFPAVVAFYPLSLAAIVLGIRRPWTALALAAGTGAAAGAVALAKGRDPDETIAFAALAPVYAAAHGLGMWRGLGLLLGARARRDR